MRDYVEIRFHGRGGGGVWTAAQIVALSAIKEGKYAQCFPLFGPERAGAPIEAYARISGEPIRIHSMVESPDVAVVLERSLLPLSTKGLNKNSILVINSKTMNDELKKVFSRGIKVFLVPASDIAIKHLGRPIVNTAMVGALVKVTRVVKLETVKGVILDLLGEKLGKNLVEKNIKAVEEAFNEVREIA
ncbi:pyruvate synthase [Candidatus Geothermarchaeota archaeon]|nr:MAG: pyruvate synthase [Candidatus Geothermarchaeota archaeon]